MAVRMKQKQAIEKTNSVLQRLHVEYVPIDRIRPNTYNPNRQSEHDFSLLLASMREDGFTQPIIVNTGKADPVLKDTIVDGEHRWRGARALHERSVELHGKTGLSRAEAEELNFLRQVDWSQVPVVYTDMTPEQMRIATLRHNRARGSEDIELTAQVLRDLEQLGALGWAQDSLQLDDLELSRLLDDMGAPDALASEEFGQAWMPGSNDNDERVGVTAEATTDASGSTVVSAATAQAIEARRNAERRMASAKTEEEKAIARQDAKLYRVHLVFSGAEAAVVQRALGDKPAEALLDLCRAAVDIPNAA